jgi:hypothetical protein
MNIRFSRPWLGALTITAVLLLTDRSWAIYEGLGPSKDDWGIKYVVEVTPADDDKVNVVFTVADEGRLKPFYSADVVAFSKNADSQGRRSYDVKASIPFQATVDGKRAGQVQIPKQFVDRAMIRILTQTFDGKRRTYAAYYDIPLKKYLNDAPVTASGDKGTKR